MDVLVIPFLETDLERKEITIRYGGTSIPLSEMQAMTLGVNLIRRSCELRDYDSPFIELKNEDVTKATLQNQ